VVVGGEIDAGTPFQGREERRRQVRPKPPRHGVPARSFFFSLHLHLSLSLSTNNFDLFTCFCCPLFPDHAKAGLLLKQNLVEERYE